MELFMVITHISNVKRNVDIGSLNRKHVNNVVFVENVTMAEALKVKSFQAKNCHDPWQVYIQFQE